jgi:hypothetical protein
MQGSRLAAQIALEFIVIYSFVLLIFIIMFALITSQRAASLAQQQYSMLQLQAQNIADVINEAVDAGNGFSATVPLQSAVSSTVPYNLTVSGTGVVIAKEKIGAQVLTAYAFSSAKSLSINGTLLPNGNGYLLPTSSGTLKVANAKGTVYIDGTPSSAVPLSYTLALSQLQHVKAASFSGSSSISTGTTGFPTGNAVRSAFAWIYTTAPSGSYGVFSYGTSTTYEMSELFIDAGSVVSFHSYGNDFLSTLTVSPGSWHFVGYVYSGGGSNQVTVYVDGQSQTTSLSHSLSTVIAYSTIGAQNNAYYFPGQIANVQLYNTALTANQVLQLYQNGIGGAPATTANVVGWWPLNGNTNDFSSGGNLGTPSSIGYNSIVYVQAHAALAGGANAANALIGGITSSGVFTQSSMPKISAYANSTGYMKAYIVAPNVSSLSFQMFGYNGNSVLAGNLVEWWPLGEGFGSTAYDLGPYSYNGAFTGSAWVPLTNQTNLAVASFNGVNSYISTGTTGMLGGSNAISVFAWIYPVAVTGEYEVYCLGGSSSNNNACLGIKANSIYFDNGGPNQGTSGLPITANALHFAGYTYAAGSNTVTLYLDGSTRTLNLGTPPLSTYTQNSVIGAYVNYVSYPFSGTISNLQVYSTALTAVQESQLYQEGITGSPVRNASISGWWPLTSTPNDYSGNSNNGIPTNVIYINAAYSNHITAVSAANFNGASSYINVGTGTGPRLQQTSSVSWWAKANPGGGGYFFEEEFWNDINNFFSFNPGIRTDNGNIQIWAYSYSGGSRTDFYISLGKDYRDSAWHHYVVVFSGGVGSVYLDGAYQGQSGFAFTSWNTATHYSGLYLAQSCEYYLNSCAGGTYYYNGQIANVQIYTTALTTSQVAGLYAEGIGGAPLQYAGFSGWWPLSSNANDYSGIGNTGTPYSITYNSAVGYSAPANTTWTASFSGSNSIISIPNAALNNINSGAVSAWIYLNSNNAGVITIKQHDGTGTYGAFTIGNYITSGGAGALGSPGVLYWHGQNGVAPAHSVGTVSIGKWYYVAAVFSASNVIFYINGNYDSTTSGTYSIPNDLSSTGTYLGGWIQSGVYQFGTNGYLANVQVYNAPLTAAQVQQMYLQGMPLYSKLNVSFG